MVLECVPGALWQKQEDPWSLGVGSKAGQNISRACLSRKQKNE